MPYRKPYIAPFRMSPTGPSQLGFDPVEIATDVSTFVNSVKHLFGGSGPDWAGTAQRVITAYMNGQTSGVEGTTMSPRAFITYYASSANSAAGRQVYAAALQAINNWDAQHASSVGGVLTTLFGGGGTSSTSSTGTTTTAGMSPLMMLVLAGAVVGGVVLLKRRK